MNSNYFSDIRFYLEFDGQKVEISEPKKFDQVKLSLERQEFHGFKPNVIKDGLNLIFENTEISNAKDILVDRYFNHGGNDTEAYFSFSNDSYEYRARINMNKKKISLLQFEAPAERELFEDLIRTRIETPVDLTANQTIDNEPSNALTPINQTLHSKRLRKVYISKESEVTEEGFTKVTAPFSTRFPIEGSPSPTIETEFNEDRVYMQFGEFVNILNDEIPINQNIPFGYSKDGYESGQPNDAISMFTFEESGDYEIDFFLDGFIFRTSIIAFQAFLNCNNQFGNFDNYNYDLYFLHRNSDGTTKSKQAIFSDNFSACGGITVNIRHDNISFNYIDSFEVGDTIIIYSEIYISAVHRVKLQFTVAEWGYDAIFDKATSFLNIKTETETPETQANLFLKHEAYEKVIRDITGEPDRFRSNAIGRTDSSPVSYLEDGKFSLQAFTNGFQIRQFPINDRPPFLSLQDMIEFDAYANGLGYGIDIVDGEKRVFLEDWREFYKSDIIPIERLTPTEKGYANFTNEKIVWNELVIGFEKWATEELNNLDEFASENKYSSGIKTAKKSLTRVSKILASGYLIEFLRRDSFQEFSSKDNDFDNDNFIVSLVRDALSNSGFDTERDQNFSLIENVFSPNTVYNAGLSRASMVFRFIEWLASCLIYKDELTHIIRFLFGEGNNLARFVNNEYDLSENGNFPLSQISPIFTPELYTIESYISFTEYGIIEANKYSLLPFYDDCGNPLNGWIQDLEFDPKSGLTEFKIMGKNE